MIRLFGGKATPHARLCDEMTGVEIIKYLSSHFPGAKQWRVQITETPTSKTRKVVCLVDLVEGAKAQFVEAVCDNVTPQEVVELLVVDMEKRRSRVQQLQAAIERKRTQ